MPDYRYLIFPLEMQPSEEEAAQFKGMADALSRRFAIGRERSHGALVIAFDAEVFDRALHSHRRFAALVGHWERRGCQVVEHLKFVKDPAALNPEPAVVPVASYPESPSSAPSSPRELAAKELAAKEAVGRSMLHLQQTVERHEAIVRLGHWMPHLLIATAAFGMIAAGFYIGTRLLGSDTERRKVTTERMVDDPMQRALAKPGGGAEESEE